MIIFVCGLSKTGKSSMIQAVTSGTKFHYLRASELLEKSGRPTLGLKADEVEENQKVFVQAALDRIRGTDHDVIIDGHLLLETVDGPQRLRTALLRTLPLDGIIMIYTPPQEVARRRSGTDIEITAEDARKYEAMERQVAIKLAEERKIPFFEIQSGELDDFRGKIARIVH